LACGALLHGVAFIQRKIERDVYGGVEGFAADMELMVSNAATYNEEDSDIVGWARELLVRVDIQVMY
jgi:hypothetical protein